METIYFGVRVETIHESEKDNNGSGLINARSPKLLRSSLKHPGEAPLRNAMEESGESGVNGVLAMEYKRLRHL